MWKTRSLINTLWIQSYLRFYEIMHYPVPTNAELYFQYSDISDKNKIWIKDTIQTDDKSDRFSRSKKCKYMDEYLSEINRLEKIFKSIPFVEQIYLCNSLTFNALDKDSDIDLFIIAEPWRIRTVKLRSAILFFLKWAKRHWNSIRKKICLSFFITSDQQNLYPISLPSLDIYLCYWIAHLVLIYNSDESKKSEIFSQNKRVKWILPNFKNEQTISLWINPFSWSTFFKRLIERLWNWFIWNIWEKLSKLIQKPIIDLKRIIHSEQNKDVIVNDCMLKFHLDIREKISLLYNVKVK